MTCMLQSVCHCSCRYYAYVSQPSNRIYYTLIVLAIIASGSR